MRRKQGIDIQAQETESAPPSTAELLRQVETLRDAVCALESDFPGEPLAVRAKRLTSLLDACLGEVGQVRAVLATERKEAARRQAEEDADARLTAHVEAARAAGAVWGNVEALESLEIPFPLEEAACKAHLLIPMPSPVGLEDAWRRAGYAKAPPYEVREPLLTEERAALAEAAAGIKVSSQDAAGELDVSLGTFRKHAKAAGLCPVDQYVTRAGFVGDLFRLSDVWTLRSRIDQKAVARAEKRREAELAEREKQWQGLNVRQRQYLKVAYDATLTLEYDRRERWGREQVTNSPWPDEPDGWRWVYHDEWGGISSLAERLRGQGILDSGAGSTYVALEERGLLERRYTSILVRSLRYGEKDEPILWVKLTLTGRRLARAAEDYPSHFRMDAERR